MNTKATEDEIYYEISGCCICDESARSAAQKVVRLLEEKLPCENCEHFDLHKHVYTGTCFKCKRFYPDEFVKRGTLNEQCKK
jgi:hypothetical protein